MIAGRHFDEIKIFLLAISRIVPPNLILPPHHHVIISPLVAILLEISKQSEKCNSFSFYSSLTVHQQEALEAY